MRSAHFSAIVITVMLGLTDGSFGIADASTTRNRRHALDPQLRIEHGHRIRDTAPIRAVAAGW